MKFLTLKEGRLFLVLPDAGPLRAAAAAIQGARHEGVHDGHVTYSYPPEPAVVELVDVAFGQVQVAVPAAATVEALRARAAALTRARAAKGEAQELPFNPDLLTTPMAHQVAAMAYCWELFQAGEPGAGLLMEQGCVDATTEYMSPSGWRRMDDWDGGEVMQYDPVTGHGAFVHPT
ncbi:MAG: hypothetical protein L0Y64_24270, partial [Myxococcaceae bacterium]|nr:hypothetical protein [Myxococcaceae bacterium]